MKILGCVEMWKCGFFSFPLSMLYFFAKKFAKPNFFIVPLHPI